MCYKHREAYHRKDVRPLLKDDWSVHTMAAYLECTDRSLSCAAFWSWVMFIGHLEGIQTLTNQAHRSDVDIDNCSQHSCLLSGLVDSSACCKMNIEASGGPSMADLISEGSRR